MKLRDAETETAIIPLSHLSNNPNSIDQDCGYQNYNSIGRFKPKQDVLKILDTDFICDHFLHFLCLFASDMY